MSEKAVRGRTKQMTMDCRVAKWSFGRGGVATDEAVKKVQGRGKKSTILVAVTMWGGGGEVWVAQKGPDWTSYV